MNVFAGHRALWLHQFDQLGETSIEQIAATAKNYAGADIVMVKAMDGLTWMSNFDSSPNAISGLTKWRETVARGAAAGVTVLPWVVSNHRTDAESHAALGSIVVVDLEPYPGFWSGAGVVRSEHSASAVNPWADLAAGVPVYLADLRAGGVTGLHVSIDPRAGAETALNVAAWAGSVDGLLPQVYWTDFQTGALACVPFIMQLQAYGVPVYPALPYNAAPGDLAAFWTALGGSCDGASLWRMGTADATQLKRFAELDVAPVDPCAQKVAALQSEIDMLTPQLAAANARIAAAQAALA